jgi:hypothetical protein
MQHYLSKKFLITLPLLSPEFVYTYVHTNIYVDAFAHDCLAEESLVHIQMQFENLCKVKTSVFYMKKLDGQANVLCT